MGIPHAAPLARGAYKKTLACIISNPREPTKLDDRSNRAISGGWVGGNGSMSR
jgi:hypothetical protein